MTRVVRKMYWAWQLDKEKRFLEDMAEKGFLLEHAGLGRYTFTEGEPVSMVYEMDFRGFDRHMSEAEYLQLYEDAGWQFAARLGAWYYFCRPKSDPAEDALFSDNTSRRAIYKRVLIVLAITGFPIYYQLLIVFPQLDAARTSPPSFYFYFRFALLVIFALHLAASIKVLMTYIKLGKNIRE